MKIDLITGFLGAGKTTFLKRYASYLIAQGEKIGIIENDFGAVNIDMMLLESLQEQCVIEMIAGGDHSSYLRRFKTKLIAMKMRGIERVLIEPSGLFDIDEFFDLLHDEPLDQWCELANVITIVDGSHLHSMNFDMQEMFIQQLLAAGKVIITKTQQNDKEIILREINKILEPYHFCISDQECYCQGVDDLTDENLYQLSQCGYQLRGIPRKHHHNFGDYDTLYIMDKHFSLPDIIDKIKNMMQDHHYGHIDRIKGFISNDHSWIEINVTENDFHVTSATKGQEVLIIIGEKLNKNAIMTYLQ